jgi:hypothetical protein
MAEGPNRVSWRRKKASNVFRGRFTTTSTLALVVTMAVCRALRAIAQGRPSGYLKEVMASQDPLDSGDSDQGLAIQARPTAPQYRRTQTHFLRAPGSKLGTKDERMLHSMGSSPGRVAD